MHNHHPKYGLFKKEWVAKRWILSELALIMMLMTTFMIGQADPTPLPLIIFTLFSFAILGITLFTRDEYDPARAFIEQLPISRRRLLALKLRAMASQIGALLLIPLTGIAVQSLLCMFSTDSAYYSRCFALLGSRILPSIALLAASSLALALLAAIVSLHIRSAIVSLILTPVLAAPLMVLITAPQALNCWENSIASQQWAASRADAFISPADLGWIALKLGLVTILLGGWLFFIFCKTRLREVKPTPRALLVFLFGVGAVEVAYTLFFTGWRDLAWLLFGI